jgi:hypothetical protein
MALLLSSVARLETHDLLGSTKVKLIEHQWKL